VTDAPDHDHTRPQVIDRIDEAMHEASERFPFVVVVGNEDMHVLTAPDASADELGTAKAALTHLLEHWDQVVQPAE
jgi:predicted phosphodiesterase